MILFCWCCSITLSLLGTVNWKTGKLSIQMKIDKKTGSCFNDNPVYAVFLYLIVFLIPLVVMGTIYLHIINIMKKRTRQYQDQKQRLAIRRTEWKVTKTILIVYTVFVISLLPSSIIILTSYLCPNCLETLHAKHPTFYVIVCKIFVQCLPPLSSVLNPFVYVLSGRKYKEALRKLLTFKNKENFGKTSEDGELHLWLQKLEI